MTQILKAALAAFLLTGAGLAEATTLTLVPTSGMLSGLPGQRVGWGFSLFNDSGWDLYVTAVSADGSLYGTAGTSALGSFRDDIALWSVATGGLVVANGATFSGSYPINGLASFLLDASAPVGALPVSGKIFLDYELYDAGLNFQGSGTLTAQGGSGDATASVSVTDPASVPELDAAASTGALTLCLAALGLARERQRGRNGHARS